MPEYVLDHHQEGERQRLALMSRLLDPMHHRHLERLGVGPGSRTLEVGCGNGSVSAWLAGRIAPSARPGGSVLLIEPDFLPVSIAEPPEVRAFWQGWLAWAREQGIDYFIGRRLPGMLSRLGLDAVEAAAETALYNGGSLWALYWTETIIELRPRLVDSGKLDDRSIDAFLARCADPAWWTQTIAFTAAAGRVPGG